MAQALRIPARYRPRAIGNGHATEPDAHSKLQREILRRKNPAFLDLSTDEAGERESATMPRDWIEKKTARMLGQYPDDYFATPDGRVYGIIVRLQGSLLGRTHGEQTVYAIEQVIAQARPSQYHPELKVGNQSQARKHVEALSGKLDPIFGRSLSPGVVLVDRPDDAVQVKRKIEALDPAHAIVAKTTIIGDLLPGDRATQEAKLKVLSEIRRLVDQNVELVNEEESQKLEALRPPDDLRPLTATDLPFTLRRYFTERDGTIGRPVLYFPPTVLPALLSIRQKTGGAPTH